MPHFKLIPWLLALIPLVGCVQSDGPKTQPLTPGRPITLTATQLAAVKAGVKQGLREPNSARFGEISAVINAGEGLITVCGYFNEKDAFGYYAGYSPFVGALLETPGQALEWSTVSTSRSEAQVQATMQVCREKGVF